MGVFGSEGWSECVAVGEAGGIGLNVQLSTNTEECWLPKHILLVINLLLLEWNILEVVDLIIFRSLFSFLFLLLLLVFLVLLSFGCFSSGFICCLLRSLLLGCYFIKFSLRLWDLQFSLKLCFGDWLGVLWKSGGDSEHFTGTFAV